MNNSNENRPVSTGAVSKIFSDSNNDITLVIPPAPAIFKDQSELLALYSRSFISQKSTEAFFENLDHPITDPDVLESSMLHYINCVFTRADMFRDTRTNTTLKELPRASVAAALHYLYRFAVVFPPRFRDQGTLAVYQYSGENEGVYVANRDVLQDLVRTIAHNADDREANAILALVKRLAPRLELCVDRDLVPVENGVFHYRTKELLPFSPDLVFTAKLRTKLVYDAQNPIITQADGSLWDVESWVADMSEGRKDWIDAWWQIVGASVRIGVPWNKAVLFYDEDGGSGKGTTLELMMGLHGASSTSALSISDFAQKFRLSAIVGKTLNANGENAVGDFASNVAMFKSCITKDIIVVENKNEKPYPYRPVAFQVQCLNSLPRTKDTSGSLERRLLYFPFHKSYALLGIMNPTIKDDYVIRQDVLEYVLKKVLVDMPNFYELPMIAESLELVQEARLNNDNTVLFWDEFAERFVWDLLPSNFLYDLYKSWFERTNPRGFPLSQREFTHRLNKCIDRDPNWEKTVNSVRHNGRMDAPEYLIAEYDLTTWMNPVYRVKGNPDLDKLCKPNLAANYRGYVRVGNGSSITSDDDSDEANDK